MAAGEGGEGRPGITGWTWFEKEERKWGKDERAGFNVQFPAVFRTSWKCIVPSRAFVSQTRLLLLSLQQSACSYTFTPDFWGIRLTHVMKCCLTGQNRVWRRDSRRDGVLRQATLDDAAHGYLPVMAFHKIQSSPLFSARVFPPFSSGIRCANRRSERWHRTK